MHTHSLDDWRHEHQFLGANHARNERRTRWVIALTLATMVIEIAAGSAFGSMALLADGWHMATHAGALSITALTYWYARRHADNPRFTFGTGKLGELGGYTSAIVLALIAVLIGWESIGRLANPQAIAFDEAIAVAGLGLVVNLVSAWLLHDHDHHHHGHDDHHAHSHHHHHHGDNNLRSAYMHVLADALTSVLAIVALLAGRFYGWVWMDAAMGIVGALVIARWAWGLMRDAGAVLVDAVPAQHLGEAIRERLEVDGDRVVDLHVWQVGPGHRAAVIALVSHAPQPPAHYKARLATLASLSHVTVEVHACP